MDESGVELFPVSSVIKDNHYGLDTTNFKYYYSYIYKNNGKINFKS